MQNPDHPGQRVPAHKERQGYPVVCVDEVIGFRIQIKDGEDPGLETKLPANSAVHAVKDKALPKAGMADVFNVLPAQLYSYSDIISGGCFASSGLNEPTAFDTEGTGPAAWPVDTASSHDPDDFSGPVSWNVPMGGWTGTPKVMSSSFAV